MILSGHQPVYLPNIQLFSKISLSDQFMFVGHCQFVNKSWHSRNIIRNGSQTLTLTVPVLKSGRLGQSIMKTRIHGDHWKKKHIKSIINVYQNRPFFSKYFPTIEQILMEPRSSLGELNIALIIQFLKWLKIETPIHYSENHNITGHKTDMLISMCKTMKAERYLSNEGSRSYVNEKQMFDENIYHSWQNFKHPQYDQGANFIENLSTLDCLFNVGPKSRDLVLDSGFIEPGEFEYTP